MSFQWPASQNRDDTVRRVAPRITASDQLGRHQLSRTPASPRASSPQALVLAPIPQDLAIVSQASQDSITATPGGGPPPVITDRCWQFTFHDRRRVSSTALECPDGMDPILQKLEQVNSEGDLRQVLHPRGLFHDLGNENQCRTTARNWLQDIVQDGRDHREVGMDPTFSILFLLPDPIRIACITVCRSEGWQAEALAQGLISNVAWLENHKTQLKETPSEHHARKAPIAMFGGGMPSAGKTSLCRFVTEEVMAVPGAPPPECVCGDGTMKGLITAIADHNRDHDRLRHQHGRQCERCTPARETQVVEIRQRPHQRHHDGPRLHLSRSLRLLTPSLGSFPRSREIAGA